MSVSVSEPEVTAASVLDAKAICACNVAANVRFGGLYSETSSYFEGAGFLETPQAVVAGPDGINAALVGKIAEGTIVCFRGTLAADDETRSEPQRALDWIQDFYAELVPWFQGTGLCHAGFTAALDSLAPGLLPFMPSDGPVIFAGHSKGGAMAALAALHHAHLSGRPGECVTFGAPRAGGSAFAAAFGESGVRLRRYQNGGDVVPLVPFEPRMAEHAAKLMGINFPASDYHQVGAMHYLDASGMVDVPAGLFEEFTFDAEALLRLAARFEHGGLGAIREAHNIRFGGDYCTAVAPDLKQVSA